MDLIPKTKFITHLNNNGEFDFPTELPIVVRNWCNIGVVLSGAAAIIYTIAMVKTLHDGSFFGFEPLFYSFFLAPFMIKYGWKYTTSNLNRNSQNFSQRTYNLSIEWVAIITIWATIVMSVASIIIGFNTNEFMTSLRSH